MDRNKTGCPTMDEQGFREAMRQDKSFQCLLDICNAILANHRQPLLKPYQEILIYQMYLNASIKIPTDFVDIKDMALGDKATFEVDQSNIKE